MTDCTPKTYSEMVARIAELDEMLYGFYREWRELTKKKSELDSMIGATNREKWRIERQLISVKKCPTAYPHTRKRKDVEEEVEMNTRTLDKFAQSFERLSDEDKERYLAQLKEMLG